MTKNISEIFYCCKCSEGLSVFGDNDIFALNLNN